MAAMEDRRFTRLHKLTEVMCKYFTEVDVICYDNSGNGKGSIIISFENNKDLCRYRICITDSIYDFLEKWTNKEDYKNSTNQRCGGTSTFTYYIKLIKKDNDNDTCVDSDTDNCETEVDNDIKDEKVDENVPKYFSNITMNYDAKKPEELKIIKFEDHNKQMEDKDVSSIFLKKDISGWVFDTNYCEEIGTCFLDFILTKEFLNSFISRKRFGFPCRPLKYSINKNIFEREYLMQFKDEFRGRLRICL